MIACLCGHWKRDSRKELCLIEDSCRARPRIVSAKRPRSRDRLIRECVARDCGCVFGMAQCLEFQGASVFGAQCDPRTDFGSSLVWFPSRAARVRRRRTPQERNVGSDRVVSEERRSLGSVSICTMKPDVESGLAKSHGGLVRKCRTNKHLSNLCSKRSEEVVRLSITLTSM